jgi:hypothetical protein
MRGTKLLTDLPAEGTEARGDFLRDGIGGTACRQARIYYRLPRESMAAATWRGEAIIVRCRPGT